MFTGLVETTAVVEKLDRRGPEAKLRLGVKLGELELGESVGVSGVCLTVTSFDDSGFEADVSAETLSVTTLGSLRAGSRVNIERASRLGDRMGGHMVLGHVDGVGEVIRIDSVEDAKKLTVQAPARLARYFAPKGSVTLDGVSLTINALSGQLGFDIMLVPHTLAVTTLGELAAGSRLNIEVDVLARYVARQLDAAGITSGDESLMEALRRQGFVD